MQNKFLYVFCLVVGSFIRCNAAYASSYLSEIQSMKAEITDVNSTLSAIKFDIDLLYDRMTAIEKIKTEDNKSNKSFDSHQIDGNVSQKIQSLKSTIDGYELRIDKLEKEMVKDIEELKISIRSILECLKQQLTENKDVISNVNDKKTSKYCVQKGDTLSKIASKYQITIPALKKLNNMATEQIFVGQEIFVPSK